MATNVVGATPATEDQPFVISIQQRQAAQEAEAAAAATRKRQLAKLKPTAFFTAPPRTEIFEEGDADDVEGGNDNDGGQHKDKGFRKKAAAAAPANLGEISGSE